jgi:tellurite resistance protein TerC
MGLRQLYFLLGGLMTKLIYLTKGLAIILGFIGVKLIIEALHGGGTHKIMGIEIPEISTGFSLSVIIGTLFMTTVLSLVMSSKREKLHDPKKSAKDKPE